VHNISSENLPCVVTVRVECGPLILHVFTLWTIYHERERDSLYANMCSIFGRAHFLLQSATSQN